MKTTTTTTTKQTRRRSDGEIGEDDAQQGTLIVVYGPPASGKTRHAEALRAFFDARMVFDEGERVFVGPIESVSGRVMVLTNDFLRVLRGVPIDGKFGVEVYSIEKALRLMQEAKVADLPRLTEQPNRHELAEAIMESPAYDRDDPPTHASLVAAYVALHELAQGLAQCVMRKGVAA